MATHDQIVCGQCSRGDVVSPGSSWCSECEEILCTPCNKIHRLVKVTQFHHLADLHEPSFIQKESFMNIPFCDKHVNKNIDLYCMFHDVVCCRTCVLESHRPCENVQEVEDVSGSIKSSALVEDVSKAVSELSKTFESIIKTRKKNLEAVNCQESVIKESIVKLKADLLKDVDLLEKSLLKDLSNFHEKTISKLDASVNEFSEMNDTWSKIKEELKFNMEYGSNSRIFILAEKIKHKLPETEMKLQDILSKIVNVNIKYCVQKDISNIIANVAAIKTEDSQCGIRLSTQMQERAQFVPVSLSLKCIKPIDLKNHGITSITGIEVIRTNKLLLCCFYSRKLFQYTEDGNCLKERTLDTRPYQISRTPTHDQVAVAMPDTNKILIIDTDSLISIRSITTENSYFAVNAFSNIFTVGGHHTLDIIDEDGKVNRTFPIPGEKRSGGIRCIRKRSDDSLLLTNYYDLYCIRLIDGTNVFKYTSNTEARDIAEDKYGCIYIADKVQKNIHRIAPDGSFIDLIGQKGDVHGSPIALRFNSDYSRLYVGLSQNNKILVFQCK